MKHILQFIGAACFALIFMIFGLVMNAPHSFIGEPLYIHDDGGGLVTDYIKFYAKLRESRIPVRVDGACVSACTLIFTLPHDQVCVEPGARFGFHLARDLRTNIDDPATTEEIENRFYPPAVRQWIKGHGPLKAAPVYMEGEEAVKLGIFPACKKET